MEGTVHIDQALTDVSIRYRNSAYIGEEIYPIVDVDKESDKYYIYGKENFRSRDDRRSPGAEARRARWTLSNDPYFCEGHALKDFVPREHGANQDPAIDLLTDTTEFLTEQIGLRQEDNLYTKLDTDMTGASRVDLTATAKKFDDNTVDPIVTIKAEAQNVAKRIGRKPNVFAVSSPVWTAITNNTKVTGRITGAPSLSASEIQPQQFASLIEVDRVIVGGAVKDTANEGAAASLDYVWGKRALLFYRPPSVGRRILALGVTFRWRKALQAIGGTGNGGQFVKRYYWEPNSADVVEVQKYYDQKTITKDAGVLFVLAIT